MKKKRKPAGSTVKRKKGRQEGGKRPVTSNDKGGVASVQKKK